MPQTIPLEIFTGEQFDAILKKYFIAALRKGLPNIHVTLKPLYSDAAKVSFRVFKLCKILFLAWINSKIGRRVPGQTRKRSAQIGRR